ncbi:hypothetical protein [Bacillus toyonensis]|uniref:hypothetical protein n=1 Tax=Bacillus toyonensis TaxID=155322 RepID=UPI000BF2C23C|nr:hypothetical protein [Bacillus toyonensis]PGF05346.1 hypothetical protein COM61_02755 [Bacillus toyonensis]
MENNEVKFVNEEFAKVSFVFGVLQHKLNPDKLTVDWDDIVVQIENIVSDWHDGKDVRTINGESVSIMSYAQRIILEKFCI